MDVNTYVLTPIDTYGVAPSRALAGDPDFSQRGLAHADADRTFPPRLSGSAAQRERMGTHPPTSSEPADTSTR